MTLLFNFLKATFFFLVIISILLSCLPYFNIAFPAIFSYTSREDPKGNKHFSEFFWTIPAILRPSGIVVSISSNKILHHKHNFITTAIKELEVAIESWPV